MSYLKSEPNDDCSWDFPDLPETVVEEAETVVEKAETDSVVEKAEDDDEPKVGIENDESHLQKLVSASQPEVLEAGVKVGVQVLNDIKIALESAVSNNTTEAGSWIEAIEDLQSRAKPTRTIVGVVGNTGAGKSSVISAVLDEERLLPTNCMRACTASPTEISYNYVENPEQLYRAEVEFIMVEDWQKELKVLFTDLLDGNGEVSRECNDQNCDAGVAYAKIKAVYPKMTKDMIAQSTPDRLAREPAVRAVLGTVKSLQSTTAAGLYRALQTYVDSKEKNTNKAMEYWPLIKVVRIYTKAAALATGACLVDLPGVQDSNAARAAVAENYMKSCTGLWIVAPITRAVDDKTAKTLLGNSFRRQLKYDGTYSAVTFICSKTDDISVTEAAESLDIEEEIADSWHEIQDKKKKAKKLEEQILLLRDEKAVYAGLVDAVEDEICNWEELDSKLRSGRIVYAPSTPSKSSNKRKRRSKPSGSRKNRRSADSDDENFSDSENSSGSDEDNGQLMEAGDEDRQPLTEGEIEEKLGALRVDKKQHRRNKKLVQDKITALREQVKGINDEKETLLAEVKAICIQGRNEYSRKAIKQDFAMGIKELDQEAAAEDEGNFNPDIDVRDYDAVAQSLPVFCVSSRAFQKLSGRLQKDDFSNSGFQSKEDTEVPQLQSHARKLTEASRAASGRRFLNDLARLLNSMTMWATNDGTRLNMSNGGKRGGEMRLNKLIHGLDKDLYSDVETCVATIREAITENVYDNFVRLTPLAVEAAVPTATSWGAPKMQGGLVWATYKATTRRNGVYAGASGPRNFNEQLWEPIDKRLVSGWERAFHRCLPNATSQFAREAKKHIETVHRFVISEAEAAGAFASVNMLNQLVSANLQLVADMPTIVHEIAQGVQVQANRGFTPVVQDQMTLAYDICTAERGTGSFKRMKDAMVNHVSTNRTSMFKLATSTVEDQLEQLIKSIEMRMMAQRDNIYNCLSRGYLDVLIGADAKTIPRAELMLRAEMAHILEKLDSRFAGVDGEHPPSPETPSRVNAEPEDNAQSETDRDAGIVSS